MCHGREGSEKRYTVANPVVDRAIDHSSTERWTTAALQSETESPVPQTQNSAHDVGDSLKVLGLVILVGVVARVVLFQAAEIEMLLEVGPLLST